MTARHAIALATLLATLLAPSCLAEGRFAKAGRENHKFAPDHVTEGWLLTTSNPDPARSWEKLAGKLVVARRGRVIRSIDGDPVISNWAFWRGGRQVAIETGSLHGPTRCSLVSIGSGRVVAAISGSCDTQDVAAPTWVTSLNPTKLSARERPWRSSAAESVRTRTSLPRSSVWRSHAAILCEDGVPPVIQPIM